MKVGRKVGISHEMDNACKKLPSGSNKASVFILYVSLVYLVTLLVVLPLCFSNCWNLVFSQNT